MSVNWATLCNEDLPFLTMKRQQCHLGPVNALVQGIAEPDVRYPHPKKSPDGPQAVALGKYRPGLHTAAMWDCPEMVVKGDIWRKYYWSWYGTASAQTDNSKSSRAFLCFPDMIKRRTIS